MEQSLLALERAGASTALESTSSCSSARAHESQKTHGFLYQFKLNSNKQREKVLIIDAVQWSTKAHGECIDSETLLVRSRGGDGLLD